MLRPWKEEDDDLEEEVEDGNAALLRLYGLNSYLVGLKSGCHLRIQARPSGKDMWLEWTELLVPLAASAAPPGPSYLG